MNADRKNLVIALLCYAVWGTLPAYWQLMTHLDPLLILCGRIVFSLVLMLCLLFVTGRMQIFLDTLKNRKIMRRLLPCALLITFNWGLFIWAVNSRHVLECSLGYYINPLIVFLLGVFLFREKCTRLQLIAVVLAAAGVIISVAAYGDFPFVAFGLALSFSVYGVLKKQAGADPISGIAVETLITTPFALAFALIFRTDSVSALSLVDVLLLIGGGAVTAAPLVMYAQAVNHVPFVIVGFFQYISPSLMLIYGIFRGEALSASQLVSFIFIGLALIVFSIAIIKKYRAQQPEGAPPG